MMRTWERGEKLFALFEDRVYGPNLRHLSGWDTVRAPVVVRVSDATVPDDVLTRYLYQRELPNSFLEQVREDIRAHLLKRELSKVDFDSILLIPGVTAGIAAVMHTAKQQGIVSVVADTPLYFSYFRLCQSLNLDLSIVSRTLRDGDHIGKLVETIRVTHARKVVIVTSPRYVLSTNFTTVELNTIAEAMRDDDWLLVDQAMDVDETSALTFPDGPSIIRLRSIGKGGGLNASRLAVLIAPRALVATFNRTGGWLYGGLDAGMLSLGRSIAGCNYVAQLRAVRRIVNETYMRGRTIVTNSALRLMKPRNGFLGYLIADVRKVGHYRLYGHLLQNSVHAMFGIHVGLAKTDGWELVRINYLLDIDDALRIITDLYRAY